FAGVVGSALLIWRERHPVRGFLRTVAAWTPGRLPECSRLAAVHQEHWAMRVADHDGCHAAEDRARRTGEGMGTHDNEVGVEVLCSTNDRLRGRPDHRACVGIDSASTELVHDRLQ